MKIQLRSFAWAALVAANLFATACQTTEDAVNPQDTQVAALPTTAEFRVVQNFVNAINAQDRAAAQALLAPTVWYAYGANGTQNSGQSFLNWLESDLFAPNARIVIERATANGTEIRLEGRWGRNGNATNRANYLFTVQNGLIASWRLL
jgi:limonene-1,2-epoxide hydrolase